MGLSLQTNSTFILENEKNGHVCSQNSYIVMLENHSSDRFIGKTSLTFQADFSIIDLKKQTNKNKKTRQF